MNILPYSKAVMPVIKHLHSLFFDKPKTRQDILEMEKWINTLSSSFDECPYPIYHSFVQGLYKREIHINGGDLICGKIHKSDYFVTMLTGRAWVISEYGAKHLIAPCSFKAKAGVKHIGFHLEDTVWIDMYNVNADTVEDAEKEIFADSYEEYDEYMKTYQGIKKGQEFTVDYREIVHQSNYMDEVKSWLVG